jgi:hypothetical protein
VEILKRLHETVRRKRPQFWPKDWILNHYKTPAQKALFVKQFLAPKSITEMVHPLYSPELDPNVFWLFWKINSALKGWRIQDTEDIQKMLRWH